MPTNVVEASGPQGKAGEKWAVGRALVGAFFECCIQGAPGRSGLGEPETKCGS